MEECRIIQFPKGKSFGLVVALKANYITGQGFIIMTDMLFGPFDTEISCRNWFESLKSLLRPRSCKPDAESLRDSVVISSFKKGEMPSWVFDASIYHDPGTPEVIANNLNQMILDDLFKQQRYRFND